MTIKMSQLIRKVNIFGKRHTKLLVRISCLSYLLAFISFAICWFAPVNSLVMLSNILMLIFILMGAFTAGIVNLVNIPFYEKKIVD